MWIVRQSADQAQLSARNPSNPRKSLVFVVTKIMSLTYAIAAICPSTNGGVLPNALNRAPLPRMPVRGFPVVFQDREIGQNDSVDIVLEPFTTPGRRKAGAAEAQLVPDGGPDRRFVVDLA